MGKQKKKLKNIKVIQQVVRQGNATKVAPPPTITDQGQTSASGHMPAPDVDNDADEMANRAGLYTEAEPDEPEALDVAKEVREAEKARRGM